MPSLTLLGQSLVSGVLIGGLYGLLALGLSLSWGLLHLVNLGYFALAFLSAYLTYHLGAVYHVDPWYAALLIVPVFFVVGAVQQSLLARFRVSGLTSLLVTFAVVILIESLIHVVWTADFRRMELGFATGSIRIGSLYVPSVDLVIGVAAAAISVAIWAWLRWTYAGLALRAASEDPSIAAAFGINHKVQSLLLAGICGATAAIAGVCIAMIATLSPAQMFAWFGVVFAVVIIGGLGNPLGALAAGIFIGAMESVTMAVVNPAWAPVVAFSVLIALLLWRPRWL